MKWALMDTQYGNMTVHVAPTCVASLLVLTHISMPEFLRLLGKAMLSP